MNKNYEKILTNISLYSLNSTKLVTSSLYKSLYKNHIAIAHNGINTKLGTTVLKRGVRLLLIRVLCHIVTLGWLCCAVKMLQHTRCKNHTHPQKGLRLDDYTLELGKRETNRASIHARKHNKRFDNAKISFKLNT